MKELKKFDRWMRKIQNVHYANNDLMLKAYQIIMNKQANKTVIFNDNIAVIEDLWTKKTPFYKKRAFNSTHVTKRIEEKLKEKRAS